MHVLGVDRARLDEFLDFGDRDLPGHRAERIEVARSFVKDQIAGAVGDRRAHQREVADDSLFHHVVATVERARLLLAARRSRRCRRRCSVHGSPPSATSVPTPAGV